MLETEYFSAFAIFFNNAIIETEHPFCYKKGVLKMLDYEVLGWEN